ncbi:MAG: hypothetical protein GYA51_17005 [Candidatus Methanofastidiosa archaeon]|nr:hypothetical protein [Candidatus Methanofastidiosa archaeon]
MRAKFINEATLNRHRVNNAGKIEINANLPIEDKFRMFDFEIPEEKEGPIIYKGHQAGHKFTGTLIFDPDFVLDNLNLINNLIDLTKAPFWYVNSREPKFKTDPSSPYVISKQDEGNDMYEYRKWSQIYKIIGRRKKDKEWVYKFKNLATGQIEEWNLYEERWRRIPIEDLRTYLTSLRNKLDEMINEI